MFTNHPFPLMSRRALLKTTASGFGYLAFAGLSTWAAEKSGSPLAPKKPHFTPRAKHVIFLCMQGGPAHVDTFDYKPKLTADDGQPFNRTRFPNAKLLGSPWKFAQHGNSGLWISDLYPEVAKHADQLCIIRSMHTDLPNHPQAFVQMHAGIFQAPRPSLGAWTLYGLGTENENLPGFITLCPPAGVGGSVNYGSSFLPAIYQGTRIGNLGQPIANATISNLANPRQSPKSQRIQLDYVQELNRAALERDQVNPGVEGVIESYELAFRMQGEVPKLLDLSKETETTKKLYGVGEQTTDNFGRQCLLSAAFHRSGRSLCRGVSRRLGPAPSTQGLARPQRAGHGQADRGTADRFAVARPVEGYAHYLGRRVRPHAVRPEQRRPRSQ